MRTIRIALSLAAFICLPAQAGTDAEDWAVFGKVLGLVQPIAHLTAHSPDPQAAHKAIDAMVAGHSAEANRIASDLFEEMLGDVPPEHRPALRSIVRDLFVLARREQARAGFSTPAESDERAIRARKELHAMGLRYWDEQQYQDAVSRGDTIAIELFLAARGLKNPPAVR